MSFIPDCRISETYNQKYLKKDDKTFVKGFDWATQMTVDNFFGNDFGNLLLESDYLRNMLDKELPDELKDEYAMECSFPYDEPEKFETRKVETYGDLIRMRILEWIESERNELITSMIDNMDEEEYDKIKKEVDGQSETEN